MENRKPDPQEEENKKDQEPTTPASDTSENKEQTDTEHPKKHSSAASLDSIITGATDAVHSRHTSSNLGNTGTNISYEGATAPGGSGSVGTGYSSGQDATGATINTEGENDFVRDHKRKDELEKTDEEDEEKEQGNDTLGNP